MGELPEIFGALLGAGFPVNELDEFTPAQYLPNDAFYAVQGNAMFVRVIDEALDDLHGLQETDVE